MTCEEWTYNPCVVQCSRSSFSENVHVQSTRRCCSRCKAETGGCVIVSERTIVTDLEERCCGGGDTVGEYIVIWWVLNVLQMTLKMNCSYYIHNPLYTILYMFYISSYQVSNMSNTHNVPRMPYLSQRLVPKFSTNHLHPVFLDQKIKTELISSTPFDASGPFVSKYI